MLSAVKLRRFCKEQAVGLDELAGQLVRGGLNSSQAAAAVKNWQRGLLRPIPRQDDIRRLAAALSAEVNELVEWRSCYRYAPMSARKVRLVTQLIVGRGVQDALDVLKFTSKRAARMVEKVLKSAMADADEQQAEVDNLYVSEARVDDAGVRVGTRRWLPKDRGRAHPIRKKACHIYVTVSEASA
ncbi:MAG: 50S ribosomal protein L22 [Planctomycetota bacterium]|jgi:large subunit ribosomal protein L22